MPDWSGGSFPATNTLLGRMVAPDGQNRVLTPALFVASSKSASLTLPNRT